MAGLAVVARHTAPRITDVYDFFAARAMPLRVLPLFDGPSERPEMDFSIDNDSIADALLVLFRHWIDTGVRVRVDPLNEYLFGVLRKMLGVRGPLYDRRAYGDDVLLVNTDGKVFRVPDVYDARLALGDLNHQQWDDVVRSEPYAASLRRDDAVVQAHCAACEYAGSCSGRPVVLSKRSGPARGRCPVTFACHEGIEQYLRESGCDETALKSLLEEGLQERADEELNAAASAA
jgi:radical SAM protein with 4Fe4S-binding SPASM domain